MEPEILCKILRANHHQPHQLCKDVAGVLWEFISYPYVEPNQPLHKSVRIKVRVPGDPTTIRDADALSFDPEHRKCLCDIAGEFYFQDPWANQR